MYTIDTCHFISSPHRLLVRAEGSWYGMSEESGDGRSDHIGLPSHVRASE
jgi:hypothetical protein